METKQEHHLKGKVGHHTILEEVIKVKEMGKEEAEVGEEEVEEIFVDVAEEISEVEEEEISMEAAMMIMNEMKLKYKEAIHFFTNYTF